MRLAKIVKKLNEYKCSTEAINNLKHQLKGKEDKDSLYVDKNSSLIK